MVWYNPTTWESPFKGWWGAPAESEDVAQVDTSELAPAPPAETESEMPTTGGRRKKHRKTKRSKKSKSKKTGRKH